MKIKIKDEIRLMVIEDKNILQQISAAVGVSEQRVKKWFEYNHKNTLRYTVLYLIAEKMNKNINELIEDVND